VENSLGVVPLRRRLVVFKGFLERTLLQLLRLYTSDKVIFVQGIKDEFKRVDIPRNNQKKKKKKNQNLSKTKKQSNVSSSTGRKRRSEVTWDGVEEVTGPRKRTERLDILNKTVATWWTKASKQVEDPQPLTKEQRLKKRIEKSGKTVG
jgi:hypothetical protein